MDVRSGWCLFVGEREAPAGEITKASRVAEDFHRSIADLGDHGLSLDMGDGDEDGEEEERGAALPHRARDTQ
ncbi:hypothetical protein Acsp02_56180 [Actinoplanes sp. NBRC 103695]|nr:hypothetical protein Acsp02_56180 [Actinoplanes sp. NBRC 103695]